MKGLFGAIVARATSNPRYVRGARMDIGLRTSAGVTITADNCVTISAVWACLRYLTQTVAVLPWHVRMPVEEGSKEASTHPVDYLLNKRPSDEWSSFQFRETLLHWALRRGNGYAEIEPDQVGRPYAMWPIHPDRVQVCRAVDPGTDAYGVAIKPGQIYYEVTNDNGGKTILSAARMFHLRGFGDDPVGLNVVAYAAESLGWAKATQLFGSTFFGNGMNISGVVMNKKPLKPDGLKRQRAEMEGLYKGPRNANKTAILDNDATWEPVGIDPQKAQLTDSNMFLVEEICRWFGVPPHKVMHLLRATFSNIEHQAIEVVVDSISPWVKRFEDEADWKLFGKSNRQNFYSKMNLRALLRGDFKTQQEGLQIARNAGAISADEWRENLDMNAIGEAAGGKKYVMQGQYTTLDKVGEADPSAPPPADGNQPADPDEDAQNDPALAASLTRIGDLLKVPAHV